MLYFVCRVDVNLPLIYGGANLSAYVYSQTEAGLIRRSRQRIPHISLTRFENVFRQSNDSASTRMYIECNINRQHCDFPVTIVRPHVPRLYFSYFPNTISVFPTSTQRPKLWIELHVMFELISCYTLSDGFQSFLEIPVSQSPHLHCAGNEQTSRVLAPSSLGKGLKWRQHTLPLPLKVAYSSSLVRTKQSFDICKAMSSKLDIKFPQRHESKVSLLTWSGLMVLTREPSSRRGIIAASWHRAWRSLPEYPAHVEIEDQSKSKTRQRALRS